MKKVNKVFSVIMSLLLTLNLTSCDMVEQIVSEVLGGNLPSIDVDYGGNSTNQDEHQHTFSSDWSFDDTYHYHQSTCEHDLVEDKSKHNFSSWGEVNNDVQIRTCDVCNYTEVKKTEHKHDYVLKEKVDATCDSEGYEVRSCSCGEKQETVLAKLEHDYMVNFELTYTAPSVRANITCSRCKYAESYYCNFNVVEHVESTETTQGYIYYYAYTTYNGKYYDSYLTEYLEFTGHVHNYTFDYKVEATCDSEGYEVRSCSCGEKQETVLSKLEHDYIVNFELTYIAPSVRANITCSRCNFSYSEYCYSTIIEYVESTETTQGYIYYYVYTTYNGKYYEDYLLQYLDNKEHVHNYTFDYKVEATCDSEGYEVHSCSCGEKQETVLSKLEHDYMVNFELTYTAPSVRANITCSRCKYAESYYCNSNVVEYVESTETTQGYARYYAYFTYNGIYYSDYLIEYFDVVEHVHQYYTNVFESTCYYQGYVEYLCDGCGDNYIEYLPYAEHEYNVIFDFVGYGIYALADVSGYCERCEFFESLGEQHIIYWHYTAPTYTEAGYADYIGSITYHGVYYEEIYEYVIEPIYHDHEYENGVCIYCGEVELDQSKDSIVGEYVVHHVVTTSSGVEQTYQLGDYYYGMSLFEELIYVNIDENLCFSGISYYSSTQINNFSGVITDDSNTNEIVGVLDVPSSFGFTNITPYTEVVFTYNGEYYEFVIDAIHTVFTYYLVKR